MAQVEHVKDMEVGDFIVLPAGEWHLNHMARAFYEQAQAVTRAHESEGPAPQFQVDSGPSPEFKHRLERIR